MRKQKCSIRVTSSAGEAWTTRRGARRMIARGVAIPLDARTIVMVESDPRVNCETPSAHGPVLEIAPRFARFDAQGQTFLPYPQREQGTRGRLARAA